MKRTFKLMMNTFRIMSMEDEKQETTTIKAPQTPQTW